MTSASRSTWKWSAPAQHGEITTRYGLDTRSINMGVLLDVYIFIGISLHYGLYVYIYIDMYIYIYV